MLELQTMKVLGRRLRTLYEGQPKGGIPDRLWQLLLELERVEMGSSV